MRDSSTATFCSAFTCAAPRTFSVEPSNPFRASSDVLGAIAAVGVPVELLQLAELLFERHARQQRGDAALDILGCEWAFRTPETTRPASAQAPATAASRFCAMKLWSGGRCQAIRPTTPVDLPSIRTLYRRPSCSRRLTSTGCGPAVVGIDGRQGGDEPVVAAKVVVAEDVEPFEGQRHLVRVGKSEDLLDPEVDTSIGPAADEVDGPAGLR